MNADRVRGAILGLALGDAYGAPFEGGLLERLVWKLIGRTDGRRRWTDDTQMTVNVVESLTSLGHVDQDDLARRFAASYRWSRGYGSGATRTLRRIRRGEPWQTAARAIYSEGSYGNGAAMRSPPIGLFFMSASDKDLISSAGDCAEVTHAHPLGMEGAVLIAMATALAARDVATQSLINRLLEIAACEEFTRRLERCRQLTLSPASPQEVRTQLGNGIAASNSCVTAIYCALAFRDLSWEALMDYMIRLRGDVDTIAAMASAIWGAARGFDALPQKFLSEVEGYEMLMCCADSFAAAIPLRSDSSTSTPE